MTHGTVLNQVSENDVCLPEIKKKSSQSGNLQCTARKDDSNALDESNKLHALTPSDVNALVSYLLFKKTTCPNWFPEFQAESLSNISLVVLESIGMGELSALNEIAKEAIADNNLNSLKKLASNAYHLLEIKSQKFPKNTLEELLLMSKDNLDTVSVGTTPFVEKVLATSIYDNFDRRKLVCSNDTIYNGANYGYPPTVQKPTYSVRTKDAYFRLTKDSPIYGIDCEMCVTTANRKELTRIAVVDERHRVVYETLVKPHNKITNYLTEFSGISEEMLKNIRITLADVQRSLRRLLPPDAILVGHSIHCDLAALDMYHPYCIDTSLIFNVSGTRLRRPGLKSLAKIFLKLDIQNKGLQGHSPVEDARTAMLLLKYKLINCENFGDIQNGFDMKSLRNSEQLVEYCYKNMSKNNKTLEGQSLTLTNILEVVQSQLSDHAIVMENNLFHSNPVYQTIKCNETVRLEINSKAAHRKLGKPLSSKKFTYAHFKFDDSKPTFCDSLDSFAKHLTAGQNLSPSNSLHLTVLLGQEKGALLINKPLKNTN